MFDPSMHMEDFATHFDVASYEIVGREYILFKWLKLHLHMGVWLSGRASALHHGFAITAIAEGPGFDHLPVHLFFVNCRHLGYTDNFCSPCGRHKTIL
jgi:hypothetical protein